MFRIFAALVVTSSSFAFVRTSIIGSSQSSSAKMAFPIYIDESVMAPKSHGTCEKAVMKDLRWNCDYATADRICCFNRHYAEHAGYWLSTTFIDEESSKNQEITFYDSVTGKPLFIAPRGRTFEEFVKESQSHGWPSFRDQEVVWENMRCLKNGESVSVDGTHLGHNLPDRKGNRYCINLVSVAGRPTEPTLYERLSLPREKFGSVHTPYDLSGMGHKFKGMWRC
eukprot:gene1509-2906_t